MSVAIASYTIIDESAAPAPTAANKAPNENQVMAREVLGMLSAGKVAAIELTNGESRAVNRAFATVAKRDNIRITKWAVNNTLYVRREKAQA